MVVTDEIMFGLIWAAGFVFTLLVGLTHWLPRMHPKHKALSYLLIQSVFWPVTAYVALSQWYKEP